jgi:predicted O-linked N-acetylglucosamine transferase (SPINDLY family)
MSAETANAAAWLDRAIAFHEKGRLLEAIGCYQSALSLDPRLAAAHNNCGAALEALGRFAEAVAHYADAARLAPDDPAVGNNLGSALARCGRTSEAIHQFQQLLQRHPRHVHALNNLGLLLLQAGRDVEAEESLRRAIAADSHHVESRLNLGNLLARRGDAAGAISVLEAALAIRPDDAQVLNSLAAIRQAQGDTDDAIAIYRRAICGDPAAIPARQNLGLALAFQGKMRDAEQTLGDVCAKGATPAAQVALATLLPPIYQSREELLNWRRRYIDGLASLHQRGVQVDLMQEQPTPPFLLAYQGFNDRELQEQYARLHRASEVRRTSVRSPASGGRRRIGFVSAFFREHTVGRLTQGLIRHLDRRRFEVVVASTAVRRASADDEVASDIRAHADLFIQLPPTTAAAAAMLADLQLDMLYYPELGMDAATYALAFFRLAPAQSVSWGHPITSGIETIDYFISSREMETGDEAAAHYSEQLVLLEGLGICYDRPATPPTRSRRELGLPETGRLYGCPQSLFKLHPDFDEVLGQLLRRDRTGHVVLLRPPEPYWLELLQTRFRRTIPDVADRILFASRQDRSGFLSLLRTFDVMLDPVHFGGGNTTLEALAMGVPVVTMPSALLRGRITLGICHSLKIGEFITQSPAEYVDRVLQLLDTPSLRASIQDRLAAASDRIFDPLSAADPFADWAWALRLS